MYISHLGGACGPYAHNIAQWGSAVHLRGHLRALSLSLSRPWPQYQCMDLTELDLTGWAEVF